MTKATTGEDKIKNKSEQNRLSFPSVAGLSLRYVASDSDRLTAVIAIAALVHADVINEEDTSKVLDHHKVQREKQKLMKEQRTKAEYQ